LAKWSSAIARELPEAYPLPKVVVGAADNAIASDVYTAAKKEETQKRKKTIERSGACTV
jgi:hypothetical protein